MNKLLSVGIITCISGLSFTQQVNAGEADQKDKPNVIMITCHDIGQHLNSYGVKTVRTPSIDKLAEKGVVFRNAFSTSGVCSPGRGSLHTGRYPQSNGLMGLTHAPWWWQLNEGEKHTAKILGEHGYKTYLVGFNHIDPQNPQRLGYQLVPEIKGKGEEGIAQTAIGIINKLKPQSEPVFIKIGFHLVHRPFTHGTDSVKGIFVPPYLADTKIMQKDLAEYQAQIHYFDEMVGEVLDALESSKVANNTLLIFTSDHGIPYPGSKWTARRAGIQVPFIFYMPGTVFSGGKQIYDLFSNVDFLPTLLTFLGFDIPENMQGMDFYPFLSGKAENGPRKYIYAQYTTDMKRDNVSRSVLTEKYQLIRYFDQGRSVKWPVDVDPQEFANHVERAKSVAPRPFAQLFDIENDPFELVDLSGKEDLQKVKDALSEKLLEWMKEVDDPLLKGPERTPYYDKAMEDFTGKSPGK
jgi:N-sulfoglucosamine sulfohydrolase